MSEPTLCFLKQLSFHNALSSEQQEKNNVMECTNMKGNVLYLRSSDLRPVHTAHSMRIQSGLMRIGLRSHCQGVNAH